jgi:hypothetical protein
MNGRGPKHFLESQVGNACFLSAFASALSVLLNFSYQSLFENPGSLVFCVGV